MLSLGTSFHLVGPDVLMILVCLLITAGPVLGVGIGLYLVLRKPREKPRSAPPPTNPFDY